jgi:hypothetical protein
VFYVSAVPRRPLVADVLNRTAGKGSRGEHTSSRCCTCSCHPTGRNWEAVKQGRARPLRVCCIQQDGREAEKCYLIKQEIVPRSRIKQHGRESRGDPGRERFGPGRQPSQAPCWPRAFPAEPGRDASVSQPSTCA